jgi:hypothetical protein
MASFTILILLIHEHGRSFHYLVVLSLVSYFLFFFFEAIVIGIVFLISFSACYWHIEKLMIFIC